MNANYTQLAAQALLILVGWYIVHILSEKRDKNKSTKDLILKIIDDLSKDLQKIYDDSVKYHGGSARNIELEKSIQLNIKHLGDGIKILRTSNQNCDRLKNCENMVVELRKSITLENFADEFCGKNSNLEIHISDCFYKIKVELMHAKINQFK